MEHKLDDAALQMILAGIHRGLDAHTFSLRMSNNISLWKDISYLDVKKIITIAHDAPIGIYVIIPFFYKQLGIDLCEFYLDMNDNIWRNQQMAKYVNNFERFPLWIMKSDYDFITLHFNQLQKTRNKLLNEGAKAVKEILFFIPGKSRRIQQHPLELEYLPIDRTSCKDLG